MDREHFLRWNKKEKVIFVDENFTIFRHHQKSTSARLGFKKLTILKEDCKLALKKIVKHVWRK